MVSDAFIALASNHRYLNSDFWSHPAAFEDEEACLMKVYYFFLATNTSTRPLQPYQGYLSLCSAPLPIHAATLALNFDAAASKSWLFSSKSARNACCGAVFLSDLRGETENVSTHKVKSSKEQ